MTKIVCNCGHAPRSADAAQTCRIKNFFKNFDQSLIQCEEQAHVDPKLIPEVLPLGGSVLIWLLGAYFWEVALVNRDRAYTIPKNLHRHFPSPFYSVMANQQLFTASLIT